MAQIMRMKDPRSDEYVDIRLPDVGNAEATYRIALIWQNDETLQKYMACASTDSFTSWATQRTYEIRAINEMPVKGRLFPQSSMKSIIPGSNEYWYAKEFCENYLSSKPRRIKEFAFNVK